MQEFTKDGVTLTCPDRMVAGESYELRYSVTANNGEAKRVVFYLPMTNGGYGTVTFNIEGSTAEPV